LQAFPPGEIPRLQEVALNGPVAIFTGAVLVVVTVLVGLAPAASVLKTRISEGITQTGRVTEGRSAVRMRETLTVVEIALAVLLLVSAGLTLRSLQNLLRVDLGFSTERVLSFKTNLVEGAYPNLERANRFYAEFSAKVAALPGVTSVGGVSYLPLGGESQFARAEPAAVPDATAQTVGWRVVRGAYFETMGLPLVRGRLFNDADRAGSVPVTIIDEDLARRFWPGANEVVGRQIRFSNDAKMATTCTVIGVVRAVRHSGPRDASLPNAYVPQAHVYQRGMFTVVKTASSPERLTPLIRAALAEVDPSVPMYFTATMERRYDDTVALPRFVAGLISAFSAFALLLAGVGIFGVTAYSVSQRTREFGIRFALGAQRAHVVGIVLGRVGRLALIGGVLGAVAAFQVAGLMQTLLFGVDPVDAPTLAVAVVTIAALALVATFIPLTRALRVNPIETLRAE
jgi:putative ABC transport system permease protein